jgi:hypothetical protein
MRVIVFTCMVGKTDPLKRPTVINRNVRYVCFTDQSQVVSPYQLVRVPTGTDPRLTSRQIKITADHPALADADVTVWHDAAFRMDSDPVRVASTVLTDCNMVAFKHPHRTQIEDEAIAIDKWGWVPMATMQAQIAAYRAEGFTQDHITSTGLCFRRRTPQIAAFNARWWEEVARWGWRDQMSVDYALWKTGVRATYIPGHYRNNSYAKWFLSPPVRVPRVSRRLAL